ncbi:helix-turn-helix transcriptional regulator [Telmatocola sphagniphila]|uniref:Helix-turn-helix transcriptional regulator n=1 Tax=Telmatocola sphagniphila TaxID=1123043 RepID=A0A8E6B2C4_9BACT|nr:PadR family transcriptional regulator [Telmatocola sphagniphila]QVL30119.1 helix-turn-helix transcriptional regulator [Telmatocola sphagniphila]
MSSFETQLRKGLAELAVLAVLAKEELYGYGIVEKLRELNGLNLSESTVYPILSRLAQENLLATRTEASTAGPTRRYYRLTEAGFRKLRLHSSYWKSVSNSISTLLEGI